MTINNKNIDNLFYIFVTSHLIFWTLIPTVTNHNLPLDTIEALAWGSNLDWGFNKHPPMSAFFIEIFFQIFGSQDWAYYLLSQIFLIISFYYVFKLSNEILEDPTLSLISVLLLESIYFFNFTTPEYNVNICQLPFWSIVVYDPQTRSMLETDNPFPSVNSELSDLEKNSDGSVDLYFGPTPPEGKEKNWIQTIEKKGWFVLLRIYGPLEPWFDKTWKPGEIELLTE